MRDTFRGNFGTATVSDSKRAVPAPPGRYVVTDMESACKTGDNERVRTGASTPAGPYTPPLVRGSGMSPQSTAAPPLVDLDLISWPYQIDPTAVAARICFTGAPLGKERARYTKRGHVYTPGRTKEYEEALSTLFMDATNRAGPDADSCFVLRCLFFRPNRQRIDCDNLMKAVSDAATGVVWKDDSQVVEIAGRVVLSHPEPRAEALIYRTDDPSPREKCAACGVTIISFPARPRRYCSVACSNASKRMTLTCPQCKLNFTLAKAAAERSIRRNGRTFCSLSCSVKNARAVRDGHKSRKLFRCGRCGNQVSRPEYKLCRPCFLETKSDPNSIRWSRAKPA